MNKTSSVKTQKLGRKVGVLFAMCLAVTIGVMVTVSVFLEKQAIEASFFKQSKISTELLAANIGGAVKFKKADKVEEGVAHFMEQMAAEVRWLAAVDSSGQIIFEVGENSASDSITTAFSEQAAEGKLVVIDGKVKGQPIFFGPKNQYVGGLIVEWSHDSINAKVMENAIKVSILGAVIAAIVNAFCIWRLSGLVARPMTKMANVTQELQAGNFDLVVPGLDRRDEFGTLAHNVEGFRQSLSTAKKLEAEKRALEAHAEAEKQRTLEALNSGFGSVVEAATVGEFERRVELRMDDKDLQRISDGVNEICENVSKFLLDLNSALDALARGDLTFRFSNKHHGQFAKLANQFNESMGVLSQTIARLAATGNEMASSIEYVASGSQTLSQHTAQQAAALEETNAAMEVVNNSVVANSSRSIEISAQTEEAKARASTSQGIVQKAVEAMAAIQESSERITEIISVIDDIAFQTNLLALNAAVEAARAGSAGKGFAVVASEVRTLAQKASESAADIRELIGVSSEKVRSGADLVNETGTSLEGIIDAIATVAQQVDDISSATKEQATGVNEIYGSIRSLEQNTSRNAQFSDGTADAASKLETQAAQLRDIVAMFSHEAGTQQSNSLAAA